VQKIGEPALKVLVYVVGMICWAFPMLLVVSMVDLLLKGRFEEYWPHACAIMFGAAAFLANLSRDFIRHGILKVASLFNPAPPGHLVKIDAGPLMSKELVAMAGNEKFVINNPGTVNIQDKSTNNNVQGGIIGTGTVHVHQRIEEQAVKTQTFEVKPAAGIPADDNDTIDINELLAYAEQLAKRPVARNTITNILERGSIESCGEVKVDKTWCNVYPRARAKEAVEKWAADKTK
jgi:hypothetical protein